MSYYNSKIEATNPSETIEGAHSLIIGIVKELAKIEDNNEVIIEANIDIKIKPNDGEKIKKLQYTYQFKSNQSNIEYSCCTKLDNFLKDYIINYCDGTMGYGIEFITEAMNLYSEASGIKDVDKLTTKTVEYLSTTELADIINIINNFLMDNNSRYRIGWSEDYTISENTLHRFWAVEI